MTEVLERKDPGVEKLRSFIAEIPPVMRPAILDIAQARARRERLGWRWEELQSRDGENAIDPKEDRVQLVFDALFIAGDKELAIKKNWSQKLGMTPSQLDWYPGGIWGLSSNKVLNGMLDGYERELKGLPFDGNAITFDSTRRDIVDRFNATNLLQKAVYKVKREVEAAKIA